MAKGNPTKTEIRTTQAISLSKSTKLAASFGFLPRFKTRWIRLRGGLSLGFLDIRYVDRLAVVVDQRDTEGRYPEQDAPSFLFPLLG